MDCEAQGNNLGTAIEQIERCTRIFNCLPSRNNICVSYHVYFELNIVVFALEISTNSGLEKLIFIFSPQRPVLSHAGSIMAPVAELHAGECSKEVLMITMSACFFALLFVCDTGHAAGISKMAVKLRPVAVIKG